MTPGFGIANERLVSAALLTAGQPTAEQLRAVAEAGFAVVINLAPEEDPRSLAGEAELARSLGMDYVNIPVVFREPKRDELDRFCAAMDGSAGKRVFVHCLANKRVTAFLGLHAVRNGAAREDAFALMREVWEPDAVWAAFIESNLPQPL